jgi:hypothetical protein
VRRAAIALVAVAGLALGPASCGGGGDKATPKPKPDDGLHSPEGLMIRDWLLSVEHYDFGRAASFFAPGAIIDQGRPFRLPNAAAARIFNEGLPCHADLIALKEETSARVLATFRLRAGPGGPCRGLVKVRYTIENGKFKEWRQLDTGEPAPEGPVV